MALRISEEASKYFGYFTEATRKVPEYDPGLDAPCPVCNKTLAGEKVVTVCVMWVDKRDLSLFYRMHKACQEGLSDGQRNCVEDQLMAMIA